jgi:hypothetical protein
MVDVGISQPVIPAQSAQAGLVGVARTTDPLPVPSSAVSDHAVFPIQSAEEKRAQAAQILSERIANYYVLGDTSFTIFKDSTGQYITRFTSLRDGKVTYIPEPSLYKLSNSSVPTMQLKA